MQFDAEHDGVTFNGPVQAGAIGFGDGQTIVGTLNETGTDERATRPERPARAMDGLDIRADQVTFGHQ